VQPKLWFEHLDAVGVDWAAAGVEVVAPFVSWLRAPADNVIVLDTGTARRSASTVNRHLAGLFGFYEHHARAGVGVAADLVAWRRVSRGSYKPLARSSTESRRRHPPTTPVAKTPQEPTKPFKRPLLAA
jgi:integrase/recombinase XerD